MVKTGGVGSVLFTCYLIAAERVTLNGVEFQRGQLVFEELPGREFQEAKRRGDVVPVDPLGDLNVQLSIGR